MPEGARHLRDESPSTRVGSSAMWNISFALGFGLELLYCTATRVGAGSRERNCRIYFYSNRNVYSP